MFYFVIDSCLSCFQQLAPEPRLCFQELAPEPRLTGHPSVYASELSDVTAKIRIVTMFVMWIYGMSHTQCVILHIYFSI